MSRIEPGDHIIYHKAGSTFFEGSFCPKHTDFKCILMNHFGSNIFKIKFKVNHNLNIFTEVVWDIHLQENESIKLDKQHYRNIKLNSLLGRNA